MILLWGLRSDPPLAEVAAALRRRSAEVEWLDQRVTDEWMDMVVSDGITGTLHLNGRTIDLDAISGMYLRPFETRRLPAAESAGPGERCRAAQFDDAMLCWSELADAVVLNRPSAMASNNSKPYQSSLIRRLGLPVPDTLVTTDASAATAFWRRHKSVVYKSISGVRSRVRRLDEGDAARLSDVAWCPTQFQQYVPGEEYRVHVVGDSLFAARVTCAADDYRYPGEEDVEVEPAMLPADVEAACLRVAHGLALPLAGIDLRRTAAGDWYALEVNPSPGFTYYSAQTGQPIAEAVANLLLQSRTTGTFTTASTSGARPQRGEFRAPPRLPC